MAACNLRGQPEIRTGRPSDAGAIRDLYIAVAQSSGNLARSADEITDDYVSTFVTRSLADGILLVAEIPELPGIAGELHAYRNGLKRFSHVLGGLTVAVHPEAQGRGIGRRLFESMLAEVQAERPLINRIELITSESNVRARKLYESLGFRAEGRFEGAILSPQGVVESDIPMAWLRSPHA
jgi:ribosomal protein S18 acetylase RimI-like enzyme